MQNKGLFIPPSKRIEKGLTVYCNKCKTNVSDLCVETGKSLKQCPFGDRHVFKDYVFVPGQGNKRMVKVFRTRDLDEARKMAIDFSREVKQGIKAIENGLPEKKREENKPQLLKHGMSRYIGILNNDPEIVPEFRRVEFSKSHIDDVKRSFKYFKRSMEQSGYDFNCIGVNDIDDKMLANFHRHLLQELQLSNRTYNKIISILSTMYNQLREENIVVKNPFKDIPRKAVVANVETISEEEYEAMLDIIQKPELGKCKTGQEVKDLFRPWMHEAIELGMMTGRRNEEVVQMQWENILLKEDGELGCIKVPDFKVNRQRGSEGENIKYIFVPISEELKDLLMRMDYEKYKGSDKYILAPEETMNREMLNRFMSRSFSHYHKQLKTGRELSYKVLRKTYITALTRFMGGAENSRLVTKHSGTQVMEQHYIDPKVMALTAPGGFKVFNGNNNGREWEMEEIREAKRTKQPTLER